MFDTAPVGNNQGGRSRHRIPHPDGIDFSKPPPEEPNSGGGFAFPRGNPWFRGW